MSSNDEDMKPTIISYKETEDKCEKSMSLVECFKTLCDGENSYTIFFSIITFSAQIFSDLKKGILKDRCSVEDFIKFFSKEFTRMVNENDGGSNNHPLMDDEIYLLSNQLNEFKYFALCKSKQDKEEAQDVFDKYLKKGEIPLRNSVLGKVNNEWVFWEI
jgi:hypothetical protein